MVGFVSDSCNGWFLRGLCTGLLLLGFPPACLEAGTCAAIENVLFVRTPAGVVQDFFRVLCFDTLTIFHALVFIFI